MEIPPFVRWTFPFLVLFSVASSTRAAGPDGNAAPRSDWLESRKALYASQLRQHGFDALIVPFQVRGNAVDRPARSLMTRYLDDRLRRTTDLRLPSVTIVSRALGETARTYDESEIYRLANDMKVKYLVRGYAGHYMRLKMYVEILVQERPGDGTLSPQVPAKRLEWNEIPFTDERPPEEAFRALLDNVVARLPFRIRGASAIVPAGGGDPGPVPSSLDNLVSSKPSSPLSSAWRLQLLGILAPERVEAGEPFFERSLVALERVPPDAPGRALLRSRALFYLHRRPAAVAALGEPSTPEEKTFSAFLDANLPRTTREMGKILSPIPLLLARIEENDLRWTFDYHLARQESCKELIDGLPKWEPLLSIRLQDRNYWDVPSNYLVKEGMDRDFPIKGYTAESLATGRVMLIESPTEGEEIELSVQRHFRKVLETRGKDLSSADDSSSPVERDALDLYAAIGDSNLAKLVNLKSEIQYLPEEGLEVLERIDGIYRGHPLFAWYRTRALAELAKQRREESRASLLQSAKERVSEAFLWSGGQTKAAFYAVDWVARNGGTGSGFVDYDRDFPMRSHWNRPFAKDRGSFSKDTLVERNRSALAPGNSPLLLGPEIRLLYTHTDFNNFFNYYSLLVSIKKGDAAESFLAANEARFAGEPRRPKFLAGILLKRKDESGARRVYEEAIQDTPEVWEPYLEYGDLLIEDGEIDNAVLLFRKYPMFLPVKDESRDSVAVSNFAFDAGLRFWVLGETEKATQFYRISADLETGSAAGMISSARVSLAEQDYQAAALRFLEAVKRYGIPGAIRYYLSLLHMMGYGKQTWQLFDSIVARKNDAPVWESAAVGHRVDGSTDEEIAKWFARDDIKRAAGESIDFRMLPVFLLDRAPRAGAADIIRKAASPKGAPPPGSPADLLEYYSLIRNGSWDQSFRFLTTKAGSFNYRSDIREAALPYIAWGYAGSGVPPEKLLGLLEALAASESFGSRLGYALFHGGTGRHEDAVRFLKNAYRHLPKTMLGKEPPIDPWYQLVESCEWLYADSKRPEYRDLAIEWARKHQRVWPMDGWAYAVEAKYTDIPADRLRALAIALYLDRRSERIADIPEEEKSKAREWLEKNNPFRIRKEGPKGT